jgi:hypothetical protein
MTIINNNFCSHSVCEIEAFIFGSVLLVEKSHKAFTHFKAARKLPWFGIQPIKKLQLCIFIVVGLGGF